MRPAFSVSAAIQGGVAIVSCSGEFDVAGVEDFEVAVETVLQRAPPTTPIEVDARKVTFCDTSAVRAIERTTDRCTRRRHPVAVRPSAPLRES